MERERRNEKKKLKEEREKDSPRGAVPDVLE